MAPFVTSYGTVVCCPICALKQRNEMHGLPKSTPFHGETARDMYDEAIQYLKE
jgi:hypothetical protein